MDIYVTRDSVAAGDDANAPHARTFTFDDSISIEGAIERIVAEGYLARIGGGRATWSVVSGTPIAVVAQQWQGPRNVSWKALDKGTLQTRNDVIGLHFNYHAQLDPDLVLQVLQRLKLQAF